MSKILTSPRVSGKLRECILKNCADTNSNPLSGITLFCLKDFNGSKLAEFSKDIIAQACIDYHEQIFIRETSEMFHNALHTLVMNHIKLALYQHQHTDSKRSFYAVYYHSPDDGGKWRVVNFADHTYASHEEGFEELSKIALYLHDYAEADTCRQLSDRLKTELLALNPNLEVTGIPPTPTLKQVTTVMLVFRDHSIREEDNHSVGFEYTYADYARLRTFYERHKTKAIVNMLQEILTTECNIGQINYYDNGEFYIHIKDLEPGYTSTTFHYSCSTLAICRKMFRELRSQDFTHAIAMSGKSPTQTLTNENLHTKLTELQKKFNLDSESPE